MGSASVPALLGRLALAMAVVLLLMWVIARLLASRAGTRPAGRARIDVLARQPVGRGAAVVLVRVAGKGLVLGVTEESVAVLAEADPVELDPAEERAAPGATPRRSALDLLRERTVRRPGPPVASRGDGWTRRP
jgi:flagellar biosynthetic protein FliO